MGADVVLDGGQGKNPSIEDFINAFDEVIGFGGRKLEKVKFGKYKNTKETMLFDKSKTLYNVNLLKKLKREQALQEVIFV